MEEKKNNKSDVQESQRLSYEQLRAYVDQLREQAKRIFQENQVLKQAVSSKDMEYAFRCLDHAELFSKKFIQAVVNRLEELMNPDRPVNKEETNSETNPETNPNKKE